MTSSRGCWRRRSSAGSLGCGLDSYLLGLVSGLERKNGWTLAEFAGDATPDGMQRLLSAARWDQDAVRDALGRYVAAELGDPGGVLIADETGFEKSGSHSAGVQRQYTGTAGKITNCQVGVFLAYAVPGRGRVLIDRELYVPRSWTEDEQRCAAAGLPEDTELVTKPQLARKMIERAIGSGVPFSWFTADEAYGGNGRLREWLEANKIPFVVAVACDHQVPAGAGRKIRADALAARVPGRGWQLMSCGDGSKGERLYEWAIADAGPGGHYLMIRRSLTSGELAYYRCWSPGGVTLADFARTAGARWAVEECFLLWGSSGCCTTLHRTPCGELLQHSSATVVLVVVADQKPGLREPATCATPQRDDGEDLIMGRPG